MQDLNPALAQKSHITMTRALNSSKTLADHFNPFHIEHSVCLFQWHYAVFLRHSHYTDASWQMKTAWPRHGNRRVPTMQQAPCRSIRHIATDRPANIAQKTNRVLGAVPTTWQQ